MFKNNTQIECNKVMPPDSTGPTDDLGLPANFVAGSRFGRATSVEHFPPLCAGSADSLRRRLSVPSRHSLMEHQRHERAEHPFAAASGLFRRRHAEVLGNETPIKVPHVNGKFQRLQLLPDLVEPHTQRP